MTTQQQTLDLCSAIINYYTDKLNEEKPKTALSEIAAKAYELRKRISAKPKPKKCMNCKHAGKQFKIGKATLLHCQHPKHSNSETAWQTLCEVYSSCNDHEFKFESNGN